MLTILSVSFTKAKLYDYLLDSRSVVKPKVGSILKIPRGWSKSGCCYDCMTVHKIRQEEYLPDNVYTVIKIVDKDMFITSHQMEQPTLDKLKKARVVKTKGKIGKTKPKEEYPQWMTQPVLGSSTYVDLIKQGVKTACKAMQIKTRR